MKLGLKLWQFIGFVIAVFLGSLLHFLYDWTNCTFLALFSSVNESTWEHMKILFFPMLFFAIFQSFFFSKEYKNFWCIKLIGTLVGTFSIPFVFYTLKGVFGNYPDFINILIFFVCAFIGYLYEYILFTKNTIKCKLQLIPILILGFMAVVFFVFTFYPPRIPIFLDPITKTYGVFKL